jgi:N-acetylglutamate synthase-like GNAT family acetyltransferase
MTILNLSCEPQHIPTLALWHHRQWQDLNPGRTLEHRIAAMQSYLGDDLLPSTYIYKHQQQLAGSAALIVSDMDNHPELSPWLASVFIDERFRRQGIGSSLVKHVMQQAQQSGISQLYLFTPDRADFYLQLGWTKMADEDYRSQKVTLMRASLL